MAAPVWASSRHLFRCDAGTLTPLPHHWKLRAGEAFSGLGAVGLPLHERFVVVSLAGFVSAFAGHDVGDHRAPGDCAEVAGAAVERQAVVEGDVAGGNDHGDFSQFGKLRRLWHLCVVAADRGRLRIEAQCVAAFQKDHRS